MSEFVLDLMKIAHSVSSTIPQRKGTDVYFSFLSELGEFAEEVNIHRGYIQKQPGSDAVVGEAADIINCLADLLWVSGQNMTANGFNDALQFLNNLTELSLPENTSFEDASDAFSDATARMPALQEMACFTHPSNSRGDKGYGDKGALAPHNMIAVSYLIKSAILLAKLSDPEFTEEAFTEKFIKKCEKWRSKYP